MKKRELEEHLTEHDCFFVHHGKKHDIWENPTGDRAPVPRHKDIPRGTVRAICRELSVPLPESF